MKKDEDCLTTIPQHHVPFNMFFNIPNSESREGISMVYKGEMQNTSETTKNALAAWVVHRLILL